MKNLSKIPHVRCSVIAESETEYSTLLGPEDISRVFRSTIETRPEYDPEVEQFVVFTMNVRNRATAAQIVTKGTLNASLVHPREVFRPAVAMAAASIIIAHNHPSGYHSPSPEDLKVTRDLIAAGNVLGIKVLDHVIIGKTMPGQSNRYLSIRDSGLVNFNS